MNITNKTKRGITKARCQHSDNIYGGRKGINVRKGKRRAKKQVKRYLDKISKDYY